MIEVRDCGHVLRIHFLPLSLGESSLPLIAKHT